MSLKMDSVLGRIWNSGFDRQAAGHFEQSLLSFTCSLDCNEYQLSAAEAAAFKVYSVHDYMQEYRDELFMVQRNSIFFFKDAYMARYVCNSSHTILHADPPQPSGCIVRPNRHTELMYL